ncbi:MAG: ATP-binding protein [Deltaproteobacteria bacterium]|nr:ATP-binding protein [Deltaproteobacteria bacterium]
MNSITKGRSPFYPGQPVPPNLFVGRKTEIKRIIRALDQVALGKPQAIFLTGEYGIGKSSLAGFIKYYAEKENHLLGIHVLLGDAETTEEVAIKTVEAVIKSEAYKPTVTEKVRNSLDKYISKQEFFGFKINLEALKTDGPNLSRGYLPFLREILERVKGDGIKGIILILDEINGITGKPKFSHFIKGLVDENALSRNPLPLLLMLCGVEERRRDMIQHHKPIERIFDIVEIEPMDTTEMIDFFTKSFDEVSVRVEESAMKELCRFSAGLPKIMHIIGDAVFWVNKDDVVAGDDAIMGIRDAAEEVGKKFVDQQVYKALRSKDYHSILEKLWKVVDFDSPSFQKNTLEEGLSETEKRKSNNFLQRMKELNVLKSGDVRGEYVFTNRLTAFYMLLKSQI